jgi:hypothetical protein
LGSREVAHAFTMKKKEKNDGKNYEKNKELEDRYDDLRRIRRIEVGKKV